MTLLGVAGDIAFPRIDSVQQQTTGVTYTYSNNVGQFDMSGIPLQIFYSAAPGDSRPIIGNTFKIKFRTNSDGTINTGVVGADFQIVGAVLDQNYQPGPTQVLIEGEILSFGFKDSTPTPPNPVTTDEFDFRFLPTGGSLLGHYAGKDAGVYLSSENSSFDGDFTKNFTGGVKAFAGPIPPLPVSLSGTKTNDTDGDGFAGSDPGLAGVRINLYRESGITPGFDISEDTFVAFRLTDSDGNYSFDGYPPGTYYIQEVVPAGWTQTGVPAGDPVYYTVSPSSGQSVANLDFANFRNITISGTKYNDIEGNGFGGQDEPLSGITIQLYKNGIDTGLTDTTDEFGNYSFPNLGPGTYFVQEVLPAGYVQTGGNAGYTIPATSGLVSTGNDFANYLPTPDIDIEKYIKAATNPIGGEGKTPGFWKQSQHFYAWTPPFVPTGVNATNYNEFFGLTAAQEDSSLTFLQALGRGGGDQNALGRHAVAAILNAANPNVSYLYAAGQIVAMVQQAYATGQFEHAKNLLAAQNELEADLSTPAPAPSFPAGLGADADTIATGLNVLPGTQLKFTLVVTNPGQTPLAGVEVRDDNGTPDDTSDDRVFTTPDSGDTANVGFLDPGEIWTYSYLTTAVAGTVTNTAVVTGKNVFNLDQVVTDNDPANYRTGGDSSEPSLTSIAGTKFRDVTGNGLSPDDVPLAGVTVKLFKDLNNDGKLTSADGAAIKTTVTANDGSYSFDGLATGRYLVQEVVTGDYVRTYPILQDYHAVNAADADQSYAGFDFANFDKNDCFCAIGSYYFLVNGNKVYDLRGNTNQGDTVKVVFTIKPGYSNVQLSLVSYKAPAATFDANTAYLQEVFDAKTGTFGPGTYSMTVLNPNCFYQVDFVCGPVINRFGPAGSNIFYTPQNRLISADNDGTNACYSGTSSLSGTVFVDKDNDGDIDANEPGIAGVKVVLTGTNDLGQYVELTDYTDSYGFYQFTGLRDGTYKVTETQPTAYNDGQDDLGSLGGTLGNDVFSNITIAGGNKAGINYNFGELPKTTTTTTTLAAGMTATIGFWQNKNGQALIKAMNGSANCKNLGNWLASNFPNLFGSVSGCGVSLAGKTNSQVADAFVYLFNVKGTKVEAQVLAAALAVYATDSDLAGGTYAKAYGFTVNSNGTGAATFNVGSNGSAIGLSNNTTYTIAQILVAANNVDAFETSTSTQTKINNLFTAINEKGDI